MQSAIGTLRGYLEGMLAYLPTHTHTLKCIKFVIALKAQDKPKNSVPCVSLRKYRLYTHTQQNRMWTARGCVLQILDPGNGRGNDIIIRSIIRLYILLIRLSLLLYHTAGHPSKWN